MKLPTALIPKIKWPLAISASAIIAVLATIFSITHGISAVYPFLYFIPIILFVYVYPGKGVVFSLGISSIFIMLVYYFSGFDPAQVAVSTAWYVIFVTIGVVTSSLATDLRFEEKKYRGIFENSQAGIFTFDIQTMRILELNEKAAGLLKYARVDLINRDLSRILMDSVARDTFLKKIRENAQNDDVELLFNTRDGSVRQFLVSASRAPGNLVICSAIDITERKLAERVIQKAKDELEHRVHERTIELEKANEELKAEIKERKRYEDAIQLANRKLNTLSSITRHDILNQITAIIMYVSLSEEIVTNPDLLAHLKKIEQITELIQKQIRFTKDYQDIGISSPHWQNVASTINEALIDFDLGDVRIENDVGNLEIFADLLLVKVFYNLVENSLRHGMKTTLIRSSYRQTEDGIIIVFEDDGVGVPAIAKDRIFKREYFRNTGYGLFLSAEILSITGISIRETGETGKGARFEIHVQNDAYRFAETEENS
jgi:PAS domain S-box-containing protein